MFWSIGSSANEPGQADLVAVEVKNMACESLC